MRGLIRFANPAMSRMLSATVQELEGKEFLDFLQKPHIPFWADSELLAGYRRGETLRLHDALLRTAPNQQVPVALSCAPLPPEQRAMVVTVLDMSVVRHLHKQLEFQAITDPLPGCLIVEVSIRRLRICCCAVSAPTAPGCCCTWTLMASSG